jgi:hypothetical protein
MSVLLYDVCLTVWFLPTPMMSAHLYEVYSNVYDVCSTVWCLPTCMTAQLWNVSKLIGVRWLYDVCLPLLYNVSLHLLYNVLLPVWFLPACDVCLPAWCLLYCTMSAYLHNFFLSIWWLRNCTMSAYLYNVFIYVWWLINCMMSAFLCEVWPICLILPTLMMSAQLRPRILRIFPFFREAVFCSVKQAISHFLFLRNLFFKWIPYSPSLSHVSDFAIFY